MAKERSGVERAIGTNTFASKTFAPGMYIKYLALVDEKKIFFDAFFMYAGTNQAFFNEKINNAVMKKLWTNMLAAFMHKLPLVIV